MKFELGAEVNESAQNAVEEQNTSKRLIRTNVTLKNQSGNIDLKRGVRVNFTKGGSAKIDGNGGLNAVHFYDVDDASLIDYKDGIANFQKTTSIDQLEATKSKISAGGSDISDLKLTKSYARFVDCKPQKADIKGGITESYKGKWQDLTLDDGEFYSKDEEFEKITISGNTKAVFNKAKFSDDVEISDNPNIVFNDCEFKKITGTGHLTFRKGKASEGKFSDKKTIVIISGKDKFEFEDKLECVDGKYILNNVTTKEFKAESSEISSNKDFKADQTDIKESRAIFTSGDLGEVTLSKSQVSITDCKSESLDTTDGALKSEKSDGKTLTMQGGTITSVNDKFETVDMKELLGPNVIRDIESEELKVTGDLSSKLWLINARAPMTDIKDFGNFEMSACSPEQMTLENTSHSLLHDCDIQQLTVTDCGVFIAPNSDIQQLTASGCQHMVTSEVGDFIATDCSYIQDKKSIIQAENCTISIDDSNVQGIDCLIIGKKGTASLLGDSVSVTTGTDVASSGLAVGMGFDPFQVFGSLSYDAIGLLLQATVGKLTNLAAVGDIENLALVGNINTNATLGNIDSVAEVGNITDTATAGQIAVTAAAGDIISTSGGATIVEAAAVQITAASVDVDAAIVNLP